MLYKKSFYIFIFIQFLFVPSKQPFILMFSKTIKKA